uniref:Uncharacterized protein n=1 Tax=Ditylenchus dipsaci TaxID=166011 RepID=A0A915CKQ1_9BILA
MNPSAIVFFKSIFLGGCFFVLSINWIRFVRVPVFRCNLLDWSKGQVLLLSLRLDLSRLVRGTRVVFPDLFGLFGLCVLLSIVIFLTYKLVKIDYPDAVPTLATPSPEKPTSTTRRRSSTTSSPKPTELVKTTIDGGSLTLPAIVFTHRSTSVRTSTSSQKTHTASSTTQSTSEGTTSTLPPSTPSSSPPTDSMKTTLDGGDLQLPALVFKHPDPAVVDDVSHGLIHRSRKPKV